MHNSNQNISYAENSIEFTIKYNEEDKNIKILQVLENEDEISFHISTDTDISKLITVDYSDPELYNKILQKYIEYYELDFDL